jgi:hypothetical protein
MVSGRRFLNLRMRELSSTVDPKRIQLSAAASIAGGLAIILGTFLPFNNSTIDGLLTISRNAYQLGPQLSDNGIGVFDSIFGIALIVLGVCILRGYRGYWFDPMKHVLFATASGAVILNQMNANKTTLSGVVYHIGGGWYVCVVGAALCVLAAFVRFPSKETRMNLSASSTLS